MQAASESQAKPAGTSAVRTIGLLGERDRSPSSGRASRPDRPEEVERQREQAETRLVNAAVDQAKDAPLATGNKRASSR